LLYFYLFSVFSQALAEGDMFSPSRKLGECINIKTPRALQGGGIFTPHASSCHHIRARRGCEAREAEIIFHRSSGLSLRISQLSQRRTWGLPVSVSWNPHGADVHMCTSQELWVLISGHRPTPGSTSSSWPSSAYRGSASCMHCPCLDMAADKSLHFWSGTQYLPKLLHSRNQIRITVLVSAIKQFSREPYFGLRISQSSKESRSPPLS